MVERLRMTPATTAVLTALLSNVGAERYGLDLMSETGLASGTLYPILTRLAEAGWVETAWEDIDPHEAGRPARRYHRLTADGAEAARSAVDELYRNLSKVPGIGKPRTA